jgi:hypothetical protein
MDYTCIRLVLVFVLAHVTRSHVTTPIPPLCHCLGGRICSYHLCIECSSPITCVHLSQSKDVISQPRGDECAPITSVQKVPVQSHVSTFAYILGIPVF